MWFGHPLRPELGKWIPAGIKENEHNSDAMAVRDFEKLIQALQKTVLLPEKVLEIHAHRIHAQRLCPTQFPIDRRPIETRGLEHLQLVDRRAGQEITTDKPADLLFPSQRLLFGPALGTGPSNSSNGQSREQHADTKEFSQ